MRHAGARLWILFLLIAVAIAASIVFDLPQRLKTVQGAVRDLGALGPLLMIAMYVAASVALVPGSVLTLAAGAIYGPILGYVVVTIGSLAGATAAFLVGRTLARKHVAAKLAGNPRFAAIDRAVADKGWRIVLLTRLSPVFPFNLQNYMYGITAIALRPYVLASFAGMIPGTLFYVYLGSAASGAATGSTLKTVLFTVGLAATAVVTVYVTRIATQALRTQVDATPRPDEREGGTGAAR